jgi:putative PEP-CTERM system histidine kinase
MTAIAADPFVFGFALAALTYLALALYLARGGFARAALEGAALPLLVAALLATALWASVAVLDRVSHNTAPAFAASALDLLRYGLWFAFLLTLLGQRSTSHTMRTVSAVLCLAAIVALAWRIRAQQHLPDASTFGMVSSLAMAVLGALLTEQLFRNLPDDSRWSAKPLCLGLGVIFGFDLYLHSEALLFGHMDRDALSVRGFVHALAVPLLAVAVTRRGNWVRSLQVSRTAAFYSATLVLVGAYMLFMAAIGYYVRYFGGDWGRALQFGLVFAGALMLIVFVVSGSLRARLRVFVGKHFFSYRYDYRKEWLRFTAMLSTKSSPQEVGGLVIRGLADMVESPGGGLWTRSQGDAAFTQTARWNAPQVADLEPGDSALALFLRSKEWVVDLDEYRDAPRVYGQLALPLWLLSNPNGWLVVPLIVGEELLGFVTLLRPRTTVELNWEVRDLLKTASRQAAGFMAQMQATEALLEARKFDAFNRMSAFVVHDLKNIVTQLSLMLKNAERLHDNREFQQDMLLTVESSLEKMRRLMLQLREGATPPGGARGVELTPLAQRLQAMAKARGRTLQLDVAERLATRGHDDRLERVLGHLVHNALDATPPEGMVGLRLERFSGQVKVDITDTGAGMSEEFVKTRLFKPFNSTKHNGMGIGTFESAQYVRELGGSISVDSEVGQGTTITVLLPLFEHQHGSDLTMPSRL